MKKIKKMPLVIVVIVVLVLIASISIFFLNTRETKESEMLNPKIKENIKYEEEKIKEEEVEEIIDEEDSINNDISTDSLVDDSSSNSNSDNSTSSSNESNSNYENNNNVEQNNNNNNNNNEYNSSPNNSSKEQTEWEKMGISEYDYYNSPVWSWQVVDFGINLDGNKKCSNESDCLAKCQSYGDEYIKTYSGGYKCTNVFSYSGKYLGEDFEYFELQP